MRNFVIVMLCVCAVGWFTFTRFVELPLGTLVRVALAAKPIPKETLAKATTRAKSYDERVPSDVDAQLNYLRARLDELADKAQRQFQGGRLYTYTFYGYALVNTCMMESRNAERRRRAIQELKSLIAKIKSERVTRGYAHTAQLTPQYGVIYQGQLNLLEAGYLLLMDDVDVEQDFHQRSKQLFQAFKRVPYRMLESYRGHVFPVDNVAAFWSLHLHDHLYGTRFGVVIDEWLAHLKKIADKHTGCIPSKVRLRDGAAEWEPRGCSESWTIAMLGAFRPDAARAEYERYKRHFGTRLLGAFAFREWRKGVSKPSDADSGPIVNGAGMAATGFGLAAARIVGDRQTFGEFLELGDVVGVPQQRGGEFYYLNGSYVLADVLSVWGKTQTEWRVLK